MNTKRKTIGLISDWLDSEYHFALISGIIDGIKAMDMNLYLFPGGNLKSGETVDLTLNAVFTVISNETFDGLILSAGTFGNYTTLDCVTDFCKKYKPLPIVSTSQAISGTTSILVDNKTGLRELILHLIRGHGYRKIAFLKGPSSNQEANSRLEVYRQTLDECGISFDPALVVEGDFVTTSAAPALRELLEIRKQKVDVIVCANDEMAWGAFEYLQKAGYSIPSDIAITGFDDLRLSRFTVPPLTTIKQPVYDLGFKSAEIIKRMVNGERDMPDITLPTQFICRESCGCSPFKKYNEQRIYPVIDRENDTFLTLKQKIHNFFIEDALPVTKWQIPCNIQFITRLIESVFDALQKKDVTMLYVDINNLFLEDEKRIELTDDVFLLVFTIKQFLLKADIPGIDTRYIEYICSVIPGIVIKIINNYNCMKIIKDENEIQKFRFLSQDIVAVTSMESLFDLLDREIKNLDMNFFLISFFERKNFQDLKNQAARILFLYNKEKELSHNDIKERKYEGALLCPAAYLPENEPFAIIVEPITFKTNFIGILLLETNSGKGIIHNVMLRIFLFNTIKSIIYAEQFHEQTLDAEKMNTELTYALEMLQNAQEQLIESEKQTALGSIVAAMAHEINTPLGISVTAASHLEGNTKKILSLYESNQLKRSDLKEFISNTDEAMELILSNLNRAYKLVRGFKEIAVDQTSGEKRQFNVKEYIEEIIASLKPQFKNSGHKIIIEAPVDLAINSFPGAIYQIITNLVFNSLKHGFENISEGVITITVKIDGNSQILLKYTDNGRGIPQKYLKKIFDPFFTTKRGQGGSGLGLHIIYNIVTQTLHGNIECHSKPGAGAAFIITWPLSG